MRRFIMLCLLIGAAVSCEQILGEHDVVNSDRRCSDDEDCDSDERCDDTGGNFCREKCAGNTACGPFRICTDGLCSEKVGAFCDSEDDLDDWCGGNYGEMECLAEDADGDEVYGYCSVNCGDTMGVGGGPAGACPDGYICQDDYCYQM